MRSGRQARRFNSAIATVSAVVSHRDRLGRMTTEIVEAAISAPGRRLLVLGDSKVSDDLVRDMVEALISFRARLDGRRSTGNRALKALREGTAVAMGIVR